MFSFHFKMCKYTILNDITVSYKTVYMGVNRWAHALFTSRRCENNNSPDSILESCICAGAGAVIALIFSVSSGYSPHGNPIQELSWSISAQAMHVSGETTNKSAAIIFIIFFWLPSTKYDIREFSYIFMTTTWVGFTYLLIPPTPLGTNLLGLMRH